MANAYQTGGAIGSAASAAVNDIQNSHARELNRTLNEMEDSDFEHQKNLSMQNAGDDREEKNDHIRFEYKDQTEYYAAVQTLRGRGVETLSTDNQYVGADGKSVYVLQVDRENASDVAQVNQENGYESRRHYQLNENVGIKYKKAIGKVERGGDGVFRDEKGREVETHVDRFTGVTEAGKYIVERDEDGNAHRVKDHTPNAGYGAYIQLVTKELTEINQYVINPVHSITRFVNGSGELDENGNPIIGFGGIIPSDPYAKIRSHALADVKKGIREGDFESFQEIAGSKITEENKNIVAGNLKQRDIDAISSKTLHALNDKGLLKVDQFGNIDIDALRGIDPATLKKLGIDPKTVELTARNIENLDKFRLSSRIGASAAAMGTSAMAVFNKLTQDDEDLAQLRQAQSKAKKASDTIKDVWKKHKENNVKRRLKKTNQKKKKSVSKKDTTRIQKKVNTGRQAVKKGQTGVNRAATDAVHKADRLFSVRERTLTRWDNSFRGKSLKWLGKIKKKFLENTVLGKVFGEIAKKGVGGVLVPIVAYALLAIISISVHAAMVIVICCVVSSLFEYEVTPDEGAVYTMYHDVLKDYEDEWVEQITDTDKVLDKMTADKNTFRFGYYYKPIYDYAVNRPHLIVQDDSVDLLIGSYTNLQLYLNPFEFRPLYPADYYVPLSKTGTTDSNTGYTVGKFADAGSIITYIPNYSSYARGGNAGHTSNIKDIICMMDVMFQFEEQSDESLKEMTEMPDAFTFVDEWIKTKLNYYFRCIIDVFIPTPHTTTPDLKTWSHMRAYAEQLFLATHQEMYDLDVVLFDCTQARDSVDAEGNSLYYIWDSVVDIDMSDENYRDSEMEGFLATGCPAHDEGGCRQSAFYSCIGGGRDLDGDGEIDPYIAQLGIPSEAYGSFAEGHFAAVGTLESSDRSGFHTVSDHWNFVTPAEGTNPFCMNNLLISAINADRGTNGARLRPLLDDSACWHKIAGQWNPALSDEFYYAFKPPGADVTDSEVDIITNEGNGGWALASRLSSTGNIIIQSRIGDDAVYDQWIIIQIPRWVPVGTDTISWYSDGHCHCAECHCTDGGGDCNCNEREYVGTSTRYHYQKLVDVYTWRVVAYNSGANKGQIDKNALEYSNGVHFAEDGTIDLGESCLLGTSCQGHDCRYCGGHTFLDVKGIIFSFTDDEIIAAGGKPGAFEESSYEIIPIIDEEKLGEATGVAARRGITGSPVTSGERPYLADTLGITGLNILIEDNYTWKEGGDPQINPNAIGTMLSMQKDWDWWSDTVSVNKMLWSAQDIFDMDAAIDYPFGFFPYTNVNEYEGWTETNMYLALQKYILSWEDTYDFDIPVNMGTPQLSDSQISNIVNGVSAHYGGLTNGEEKAITAALEAVGNGTYSQMHHEHGYLLSPHVGGHDSYLHNATDGYTCTTTDCSGFASYVVTMGGDSRISGVWSTETFLADSHTSAWDGSTASLRPGDIFIHEGNDDNASNHALVYIGCLDTDLTISFIIGSDGDDNGGYTFAKDPADDNNYIITSTITIKAGEPITVDCTRLDSKGGIYLRNGGIEHSWLPVSEYITGSSVGDGVSVYHPNYAE